MCMVPLSVLNYIYSRMKKDNPTVFVPLLKRLIQLKPSFMAGVTSCMYYVCSCTVVLWYIQYVN